MTSRSYCGKMNSTLGSVVPLAMFAFIIVSVFVFAFVFQFVVAFSFAFLFVFPFIQMNETRGERLCKQCTVDERLFRSRWEKVVDHKRQPTL